MHVCLCRSLSVCCSCCCALLADATEWPALGGYSAGPGIKTDTWYLVYVGSKVQTQVGPYSVENLGIRIEINDGTLVDSTNNLYNARTVTSADMETAYPLWETVATLQVHYFLTSSLISPSTSPSSSTFAMQEQLSYTLYVMLSSDIYSDGWVKCVSVDGNLVVTPKSGYAIDSSTLRVLSVPGSEKGGYYFKNSAGDPTSYWTTKTTTQTTYGVYVPSFSIVSKNLSVNTTSVLHCTTGGSLAPRDYYVTFAITDSWTPCADASCSRVLSSDPNAPEVVAPGGTLNVYVSNGTNSQTTDVYLYFACATTTTCLTNFTGTGPDTYTSGSTSYKGVKISGSTAAFTGVYGTPIIFTANASASSATELVTIQTSNTNSTTLHAYNANIYVRVNVATVTFYSDSTGATAVSTKSAWPTSIAEGATLTLYPKVNQNLAATGTVTCTTTSSSITVGGALTVTMTGTELTGDSKWHSGGVYLSGISVTANAVTADTGALAITCAGTGGVATDQVTLYVQVVAKEANLSYSYICDYPSCLVASYVTNPGWLKFGTSVGTQTSWTVGQTLLIYPMIDRDIDSDGTITCYASWSGNDTTKPYAVLGSGSTYSTVSTCTNSGVCQTTSVTLSVKAMSGSELASTTGSWRNYGVYGTPMTITGLMYANTITVTCTGSGNDSLSTAPYNFYVLFTPASGANWVTPFRMYTSNTSPPPDSSAASVNPAYPTVITSGSTITIYPTLQSSLPSTSTGGSITCSTLATVFYPDAGKLTVSSSTLAVPGPKASNYVAGDWNGLTYTKGLTITASSVAGDSGVIGVACIGTSGGDVYPVSPAGVYLYFKVQTSLPGVTYYSDAAGATAVSTSSIAPTTVSAGSTLTLYPSFSSGPGGSWTITCTSSDTASLTVSNSGTLTGSSTSSGTQTTGLTLSAQTVTQDKFVTVTCTGDGSVLASTSVQLSLTVQSAAAVFTLYSSNTTASSTTAVSTVITSPTSLAEGSTLTIYPKADRTVAANGTLTCTHRRSQWDADLHLILVFPHRPRQPTHSVLHLQQLGQWPVPVGHYTPGTASGFRHRGDCYVLGGRDGAAVDGGDAVREGDERAGSADLLHGHGGVDGRVDSIGHVHVCDGGGVGDGVREGGVAHRERRDGDVHGGQRAAGDADGVAADGGLLGERDERGVGVHGGGHHGDGGGGEQRHDGDGDVRGGRDGAVEHGGDAVLEGGECWEPTGSCAQPPRTCTQPPTCSSHPCPCHACSGHTCPCFFHPSIPVPRHASSIHTLLFHPRITNPSLTVPRHAIPSYASF